MPSKRKQTVSAGADIRHMFSPRYVYPLGQWWLLWCKWSSEAYDVPYTDERTPLAPVSTNVPPPPAPAKRVKPSAPSFPGHPRCWYCRWPHLCCPRCSSRCLRPHPPHQLPATATVAYPVSPFELRHAQSTDGISAAARELLERLTSTVTRDMLRRLTARYPIDRTAFAVPPEVYDRKAAG